MFNYSEVTVLSEKYNIPIEDILMIALNRYGVLADIEDKRIRFKIKLNTDINVYYCAVCVNTYNSPFHISSNGKVFLDNKEIGEIFEREKDTCDSTYFRRNGTALTLNSNMRSQCKGCKFCGSYNLDPADMSDLNSEIKLARYIEMLLETYKKQSFEDLVRITICTGCFRSENELVEHMLMVREVFERYGFNKRLRYIGSQLRSDEAMRQIAEQNKAFSLTFTTECFSRRQDIMRQEKAELNIDNICEILQRASTYKFSTNYLYILGLDNLEVMKAGMEKLKNSINRFPGVQILQNFVEEQENQRIPEAKNIEYYLEARKIIEKIYGNEMYKPRSWENYRGLFYTTYNLKQFDSIRI